MHRTPKNMDHMMNTLRTLLLTGTLLMVSCAGAQNGDGPKTKKTAETKARERTEGMTADLALTAEQVPRVLGINRLHAEKMAALAALEKGSDARKTAKKEVDEWYRKELETVLTRKQLLRMETLRKERKKAKKAAERKQPADGGKDAPAKVPAPGAP